MWIKNKEINVVLNLNLVFHFAIYTAREKTQTIFKIGTSIKEAIIFISPSYSNKEQIEKMFNIFVDYVFNSKKIKDSNAIIEVSGVFEKPEMKSDILTLH